MMVNPNLGWCFFYRSKRSNCTETSSDGTALTLMRPTGSAGSALPGAWRPAGLCSWTSQPSAPSTASRSPARHPGSQSYAFNHQVKGGKRGGAGADLLVALEEPLLLFYLLLHLLELPVCSRVAAATGSDLLLGAPELRRTKAELRLCCTPTLRVGALLFLRADVEAAGPASPGPRLRLKLRSGCWSLSAAGEALLLLGTGEQSCHWSRTSCSTINFLCSHPNLHLPLLFGVGNFFLLAVFWELLLLPLSSLAGTMRMRQPVHRVRNTGADQDVPGSLLPV